jgi:hypothetical protein
MTQVPFERINRCKTIPGNRFTSLVAFSRVVENFWRTEDKKEFESEVEIVTNFVYEKWGRLDGFRTFNWENCQISVTLVQKILRRNSLHI